MLSCPVVQLFLLAFPADKRLAIKAQTNCSEFTLVFCCTAQLALAILLLKFSLPPSLWRRGWFAISYSNKLGSLLCGAVKSAQRLPPSVLATLPMNIARYQYSCPIQHVLSCSQLVVLGR